MEFIANFMTAEEDPVVWAQTREAEGWNVLGCADHFFSPNKSYPHVWVTLATMAAATKKVKLTTSFANNLFRSPVEFAQASLQMQSVSHGRFEAGLGAGWEKAEAEGSSIPYPSPSERAGMYIESAHIVRELFDTGGCTFSGKHYNMNIPKIGPMPAAGPPPLVASLGGPRTIKGIARNGSVDLPAMATIPESHLYDLVQQVRSVNPTVPLSVFILCSVGDDARTKAVENMLGDSFLGGFYGSAAKVSESMFCLAEAGIDRVEVSPFTESSFANLATKLFA